MTNVKRPTIARLVTTTWGWSLVALFLCVTLAMGVYSSHPFYKAGEREMTPLQEFLPLLLAGLLWSVLVALIVLQAVLRGRKHKLDAGDLSHVKIAHWFLFVLSAVFTLLLPGAIGASIATFVNACLLIMCLIYIAITAGIAKRIERNALLCTCGVVLSTAACWI